MGFAFIFSVFSAIFSKICNFGKPRLENHSLDLSTLESLIGTAEADVTTKLMKNLAEDNFTLTMYKKGFLSFVSDSSGTITGFDFQPPSNYQMTITGSDGNDNIETGKGNDTVDIGAGNDTVDAGEGNDTVSGGTGDDTLLGGKGEDMIDGGDDNDTITGGDGDDMLSGGAGFDTISGGLNNDMIDGGADADILNGNDGNDFLYGGTGADTLFGDAGNDTVNGGFNIDSLSGGLGADTFAFSAADLGSGSDTIQDFSVAQGDKIDLSDILTAFDPLTNLITDFVRITDNGTNSFVAVDVDGGGDSFQAVAAVLNTTGLTDEQQLMTNGTLVV